MNIALVGAHGVVGSALAEHFTYLGHTVLMVDTHTTLTLEEAARDADIICIVTLPIHDVPALITRAALHAKDGVLIMHGSSIEFPRSEHVLDESLLREKHITLCHCHFHFRPDVPLRRTLFGQHVTASFSFTENATWKAWVTEVCEPFGAVVHELAPHCHDTITTVSQLTHMITSLVVGEMWRHVDPKLIEKGLTLGGHPFRSLIRSVLRTASAEKIAAGILLDHPQARAQIALFREALQTLEYVLERGDATELEAMAKSVRSLIPHDTLAEWDTTTTQLIRLDADLGKFTVEFHFPPEKNEVGLLAKVLREFDIRDIGKTTTIAQINPDGSCTFRIGVVTRDEHVEEAVAAVHAWS